uniref:Microcephalin 1 n=3 Tax=Homininae TaxID=207598 RepID=A0A8I5KYX6_HUMAN
MAAPILKGEVLPAACSSSGSLRTGTPRRGRTRGIPWEEPRSPLPRCLSPPDPLPPPSSPAACPTKTPCSCSLPRCLSPQNPRLPASSPVLPVPPNPRLPASSPVLLVPQPPCC